MEASSQAEELVSMEVLHPMYFDFGTVVHVLATASILYEPMKFNPPRPRHPCQVSATSRNLGNQSQKKYSVSYFPTAQQLTQIP